jgi:pimeloyl-ACP methyl ester carboxylesterase
MRRMDLQVMAMVEHARGRLREERKTSVRDKAVYVGFSAGGHFVSRMAVLHPERVLAVWCGGTGGHPILPFAEYSGRQLSYPAGVGDVEEISGTKFDARAFRRVPMLFVQGSEDTNASLPANDEPSDSYRFAQAEDLRAVLGLTTRERFAKAKQIYADAGANAEFRTYEGVAHQITPQMAGDIVQFIEKCVNDADEAKAVARE